LNPAPIHTADESLRTLLHGRLAAWRVEAHPGSDLRRAAVALTILEEGHGAALPGLPDHEHWSARAALLLTRRADTLRQHAGQWALPGGRVDADETAEQAALRELHEEVGLQLDAASVLGRLDDYVTRSGYAITPVVVWAGRVGSLQPNPAEVRSVHRIPVDEFMRADAPLLNRIPQSVHPVLRMPVGHGWIAAPTAALLYQFRQVLIKGEPTRVAHFEQPVFAWK
jgi:mutator protein MutT